MLKPMTLNFPFCRVVGQPLLKTALMLISIDPKLGGLLISGPRGSAKSTMVRGLSDLQKHKPFTTLPLGASEEMITGSLDLEGALSYSKVDFKPGLLARADGGLLYVDEVNLLPDHLVDLLLDAAASGINIVERDGISHQHSANFSLIGTMNPDEGELRPQLLDRFGLMVEMQNTFSIEQRVLIVKNRLEFDKNPKKFVDDVEQESEAIKNQITHASKQLSSIVLPKELELDIARRCSTAEVEGMRADIIFHRAAKAYCALQGNLQVSADDLDAVEPLVLCHRTNSENPPKEPGNSNNDDNGQSSSSGSTPSSGSSIQGSWGAMPYTKNAIIANNVEIDHFENKNHRPKALGNISTHPDFGRRQKSGIFGSRQYSKSMTLFRSKVDWIRTLSQSGFSTSDYGNKRKSLKLKKRAPGTIDLDLLVLDTSASTLSGQGLGYAQGAIQNFSKNSYINRRHLGIVTFGNDEVKTLLFPQRAPKDISPLLQRIAPGGGTPIFQALNYVEKLLLKNNHKSPNSQIYLITDGRLEGEISDHPLLRALPITIIDIESSRVKLGLAKKLANNLDARYFTLSNSGSASINTQNPYE